MGRRPQPFPRPPHTSAEPRRQWSDIHLPQSSGTAASALPADISGSTDGLHHRSDQQASRGGRGSSDRGRKQTVPVVHGSLPGAAGVPDLYPGDWIGSTAATSTRSSSANLSGRDGLALETQHFPDSPTSQPSRWGRRDPAAAIPRIHGARPELRSLRVGVLPTHLGSEVIPSMRAWRLIAASAIRRDRRSGSAYRSSSSERSE
jgi:hypothetical protein